MAVAVRQQTRTGLTREQVAKAALQLADADGLEALSMRALADRLGVGTMTLYGYFRNKDELLDAVVDSAVGEGELPSPDGDDWREQLRTVVLYARSNLLRHPSLVELRVRRPVLRPEALRFSERCLAILRGAGLDVREGTAAFRLLFTYTFGFAALSPAGSTDDDRRAALAALAALPQGEYPALTEAREEASRAMGGDEVFEYGLDRILDGLEARLGQLS
jgi:AcrR family transcriptional regulator